MSHSIAHHYQGQDSIRVAALRRYIHLEMFSNNWEVCLGYSGGLLGILVHHKKRAQILPGV